jgi:hypothetical protein
MADLFTFTSVVSLAATGLYAVVGVAAGFRFGKKLPSVEKWIIAWLVFDALIHFTLVCNDASTANNNNPASSTPSQIASHNYNM